MWLGTVRSYRLRIGMVTIFDNRDMAVQPAQMPVACFIRVAVDKFGKTLDFMLSERRNTKAARRFFRMAINTNGVPDKVVIDKSGANLAGLQWANVMLKFTRSNRLIEILQVKYLNNTTERNA